MIIFMIEVTSENGIRLTATENNRKEIRLLIIHNKQTGILKMKIKSK